MVTKYKYILLLQLILLVATISCKKQVGLSDCIGFNFRHLNTKTFFTIENELDSFPQNYWLKLKVVLPRNYYDETNLVNTIYSNNVISSNFGVVYFNGIDNRQGVFDSLAYMVEKGRIEKDSLNYSLGQLETIRTFYAVGNTNDTNLELKFAIQLKKKGDFGIFFSRFAGRESDCSVHLYKMQPKVINQNIYLYGIHHSGPINYTVEDVSYYFRVY